MDQLPRQPRDQPGLGLGDQLGELLGDRGQASLGSGRPPGLDPLGAEMDSWSDPGGLQVVANCGRRPSSPTSRGPSRVVGLGQQRHPDLQAPPGVHYRVMADVGLHLDQPALEPAPAAPRKLLLENWLEVQRQPTSRTTCSDQRCCQAAALDIATSAVR